MRAELVARFGDEASIVYIDTSSETVREEHAETMERIEAQGLLYPVTVVDGVPLYDGAVSYPAILRAVHNKLVEPVAGS